MKVLFIIASIFSIFINGYFCDDVAFIKLGTYNGGYYKKEFYRPRFFKATWQEALSLCFHFGMELASFESSAEYDYFRNIMSQNRISFDDWTYVGGFTQRQASSSNSDWFWANSNQPISYKMSWSPGEPNNRFGKEWCLSIDRDGRFNDSDCDGYKEKFICEKKCLSRNEL